MEFHRARLGAMRAAIDDLIRRRHPPCWRDSVAQLIIRSRIDRGLKSADLPDHQPAPHATTTSISCWCQPARRGVRRADAGQARSSSTSRRNLFRQRWQSAGIRGARAGQLFLLARVTEYLIDGALDDPADMYSRLLLDECQDFIIHRFWIQIRPAQQIECTSLGGYAELIRQIEAHRAELAVRLGGNRARAAVASWYDWLYVPIAAGTAPPEGAEDLPGR